MKLRQLLFVHAVAETHSFSRAAEQCHATQPTLSNAIAQLEEELGGKLFTRTTRKVELTPFGTYLLPFVRSVLDGRDELEKAALAYHNPVHKLLRIGFSPLIDVKLLNRVIEPYRTQHPDISIFFKECFLDDLSQRFVNDTIDIAIVPQAPREAPMERCFFYHDALFYLPQESGPQSAHAGPLRISALPNAPIILTGGGCGLNDAMKDLFEAQGAKLRPYPGQAISYQVIEEWASLGIAAGILPEAKLSDKIRSGSDQRAAPLLLNDGRPALFSYEWIWNSAAPSKSHLADFIGYIKATIPALVSGETGPAFSRIQTTR